MTYVMERAGFWKMNGSESAKSRLKHEELARQLVRPMQDAYAGHSSFIAHIFIARTHCVPQPASGSQRQHALFGRQVEKEDMLDNRTKALVEAIGLGAHQSYEVRLALEPEPELELEPELEPEPVPMMTADVHTIATKTGQASVRAPDSEVVELEQSYLAAVITAQQLAKQMLEMTNRWVTLMDEREEDRV